MFEVGQVVGIFTKKHKGDRAVVVDIIRPGETRDLLTLQTYYDREEGLRLWKNQFIGRIPRIVCKFEGTEEYIVVPWNRRNQCVIAEPLPERSNAK